MIPYPVTPYLFEIDTLSGAVLLEMDAARYETEEPARIRLTPMLEGYERPLQALKEYFKSYGFGMHGKPVDLDMAAPADIHHILIMSQGYYQGKQNLIRGFQVLRGFIPPEGFADLSLEAEDVNPVLKSVPLGAIMEGSTGPKTINDWLKKIANAKSRDKKTDLWYEFLDSGGDTNALLRAMILSLPAGCYKLHSYKYGNNITDAIHEMYGTCPTRFMSENIFLGLTAVKPNKVYASFTHGLDAIEIYPAGGKKRRITESAAIDREANKAAASPENDLPEPTEAQKKSGNYAKGHVVIQGLEIAIENPAGSERSGIGADGKRWTSKIHNHYGYIKGTEGKDKDHIDVFLGPDPEGAETVFIVNQTDIKSGKFDEHKIMLGFASEAEARKAYLSNYEKGWQGLGSMAELTVDDFKTWLQEGDTKAPIDDDEILESAGGVLSTLTGKELGENIDSGNAVASARNYFRAKMQGKTVTRQGVGEIRFSGKGWKKFKRGVTTDIKKAKLLPAASAIILRGKHSVSEPFKARNDNITRFHFFDGKVELEGETLLVGVTVGEDEFGHLFYNLNHDPDVLYEKRKAPILPRVEARGSEPYEGQHDAPFNMNINSPGNDVKKKVLESSSNPNSWIGVDLDGTLARYDGWKGYEHIGEPVPLMMDIVKEHLANGETVKIFTARAADPEGIPPVRAWLEKNDLAGLDITNQKDQNMTMLYDDRAAKVVENMGVVLEGAKGVFKKQFAGGKLTKQRGCSTDDKGCEMHYIRYVAYGPTEKIVEETYCDDYGFGIQAKTLKELKKKMAEYGGSSITEAAEDPGWKAAIAGAQSFDELSAAFTKVFPIAGETTAKQKEPWEMTSKEYGESIGSLSFPQTFGMHLPIIIDALKTGKLSHEEYARLYEKDYGNLEEMTGQKRKEPLQRTTPAKGTPERTELDKQVEGHKASLDAAYDALYDAEQARNKSASGSKKRDAAQRKVDKLQTAYNELLHSPVEDQGKIAKWEDVAETGDELQRIEARRLLKLVSDKDGAAMEAELFTERLAKRGLAGDDLTQAVNEALLHSFKMSDGLKKTLEIAEAKQQAPALQADYRRKIDALDISESDKARFKKDVEVSIWPEYMDKAYKDALKLEESVGPGIRGKREAEEIIREEEKERRAALEAAKIKLSDMADKPDPKKFYSRLSNGELREVKGHNLTMFAGIDLFTSKDANGQWAVTEGKSGTALAMGYSTQREAIAAAKELIEQRGGAAGVNKMALNLAKEHGLSPRWAKETESPESGPETVESDNGPTTIKSLLARIIRSKDRKQKDELYLSVYGNDRRMLLEAAILKVKPGTYTLAAEGKTLQSALEPICGLYAALDANKRFLRGMEAKYPKAVITSFTLGLQEVRIKENASKEDVWG